MLDFLALSVAFRFFVFDYKHSPVSDWLAKIDHPIAKDLSICSFCQGCEIGFILQILGLFVPLFDSPHNIVSILLRAIAAGYFCYAVGILLNGSHDELDFDFVEEDQIVVE
jgi:hypothetical protein